MKTVNFSTIPKELVPQANSSHHEIIDLNSLWYSMDEIVQFKKNYKIELLRQRAKDSTAKHLNYCDLGLERADKNRLKRKVIATKYILKAQSALKGRKDFDEDYISSKLAVISSNMTNYARENAIKDAEANNIYSNSISQVYLDKKNAEIQQSPQKRYLLEPQLRNVKQRIWRTAATA